MKSRRLIMAGFLSLLLLGITCESIAQSLYSGTLQNEKWVCIVRPDKLGPISETKVAELSFGITKLSKRGTSAQISFPNLQLKTLRENWSSVALSVEYKNKSIKRSVIQLQATSEVQPIKFSVELPQNMVSKVDFRPTLQGITGQQDSTAGCIPTTEYEKLLPKENPATKSNADPVLLKIKERINNLTYSLVPAESSQINWVVSPAITTEYRLLLEAQHEDLARTFPTLYSWSSPATIVVGNLLKWTPPGSSLSSECSNFINKMKTFWSQQDHLDNRLLAGTSYCDNHMIVAIRPNPSQKYPDVDLMAQELGGIIQENSRSKNALIASLQPDQLQIPTWYAQGSQSMFSFISYIAKNQKIDGAPNKVVITPDCVSVSMKDLNSVANGKMQLSNCPYTKGFAAVRLMIALYGWDAPLSWYGGFTNANDYEAAFEKTFGISLANFGVLADEYWGFLVKPSKTPTKVLKQLAQAG